MLSAASDGAAALVRRALRRVAWSVLFVVPAAALAVTAAQAQVASLRLSGSADATVPAARINGADAYPASALAALGFTVSDRPDGVMAVSGADTLRFWTTSPFFLAGSVVHQLAFDVQRHAGAVYLPEQFFIRWLPDWRGDRYAYAAGALVLRSGGGPAVTRPAVPTSVTTVVTEAARTPDPAGAARAAAARAAARTRVVVIDAGHGGRDPGKVGPNGLREKDVTLLLSQRLGTLLEQRGYEVHLTRTADTLIALHDRPRLANSWRGERPVAVFLSIHANAFQSPSVRGFETFFLSEARTEDERRVAAMENEAIRFEDEPPAPTDDGLGQILNNLRSDFLMRSSHELATIVQNRLATFHPGPNRGVKRGELIVLIGSIMPSVLIEVGFLSNREEAGLIGSQAFQHKIVGGIADAVDEFFNRNEHLWVYAP
ncbi:MAG TPA: N-acetylmuramoyl-L-alanine amidase [Longimicrobiales bacterium]|nr:N-acetylmuramoyl-L-alanine amidase [Longimicrobiales bacterium]